MFGWGYWGDDSGGVDLQGTITTTFTWQPDDADDPPPTDVVIAEQGEASMTCSSTSNAAPTTVTVDSDLGFDFAPTSSSSNSFISTNGASSGTRYKLKHNPGSSFTITCSPKVSINGTGSSNPEGYGSGGASVYYKATATPLEIVLSGGIGTKNNKRFLIGQQVMGTVTAGGLTANGFNWTASGYPFKNWQFSWTTQYDSTAAILVPFGTNTQPSVTFYYSQPSRQSIVATSVHLIVPAGSLPAAGLDTNLSRTCKVEPPEWTITATTGTTQLQPLSAPDHVVFDGAPIFSGSSSTAGIVWEGMVRTPAAYTALDDGGWNVTQLVTPHRVRSENGTLQGLACNDVLALDTTFGYEPVYDPTYTTSSSLYPAPHDGNIICGSRDSPSTSFDSGTESLINNDSFNDYLMYIPPGTGSCFVPLENFTWFWKGQVLPDNSGGWQLFNAGGSSTPGSHYPAHPVWSSNAGQGLYWVDQP